MASRRDELNAYTFSRRRTVAAFLRPSSGGDDEQAPRAFRAFMPSLVVGAVAVAAFGAYGIFKPSAPKNWQSANAIIVGKQSTARYVMVTENGKRVLHPVLNLASAKLLLDANSTVEEVDDSILDSAAVLHGAAVGIPYAPDWLPSAGDAGTAKTWAVCDKGGNDAKSAVAQALLVLNQADAAKLTPSRNLGTSEGLLVQTPDGAEYLVDSTGASHQLDAQGKQTQDLAFQLFSSTYYNGPEQVSSTWLQTLKEGRPIHFPKSDLTGFGHQTRDLDGQTFTVGTVVQVSSAGASDKYVVTSNGVQHVSDFTAQLLMDEIGQQQAQPVTVSAIENNGGTTASTFEGDQGWPAEPLRQVNSAHGGDRVEVCSTYTTGSDGSAQRVVWAGFSNPFSDSSASSSVYITPGSGLLYREYVGTDQTSGKIYLLTQNGIKYPIQVNTDASSGTSPTSAASPSAGGSQQNNDLARLGYASVSPVPVPDTLSALLPNGPTLDSEDAGSPQHS
jgi:type VII secretion protein EccB